jgi:hypothetical protein
VLPGKGRNVHLEARHLPALVEALVGVRCGLVSKRDARTQAAGRLTKAMHLARIGHWRRQCPAEASRARKEMTIDVRLVGHALVVLVARALEEPVGGAVLEAAVGPVEAVREAVVARLEAGGPGEGGRGEGEEREEGGSEHGRDCC